MEPSPVFRFMDLPKELRLWIYDFAVDVRCYEPGLRPRGLGSHDNITGTAYYFSPQGVLHAKQSEAEENPPGEGESPSVYPWRGPALKGWTLHSAATELPAILRASRQIRDEALPHFYAAHDFEFYDCDPARVLEWLVLVSKSIKLHRIHDIGLPQLETKCYPKDTGNDAAAIKACYLLLELNSIRYTLHGDNERFDRLGNEVVRRIKSLQLTCAHVEKKSVEELTEMVRPWEIGTDKPAEGESDQVGAKDT